MNKSFLPLPLVEISLIAAETVFLATLKSLNSAKISSIKSAFVLEELCSSSTRRGKCSSGKAFAGARIRAGPLGVETSPVELLAIAFNTGLNFLTAEVDVAVEVVGAISTTLTTTSIDF